MMYQKEFFSPKSFNVDGQIAHQLITVICQKLRKNILPLKKLETRKGNILEVKKIKMDTK